MKPKFIVTFALVLGTFRILAQGTLEFDQQTTPPGGTFEGVYNLQPSQPIGQSFTPSLNSVGFVQLGLDNPSSANSATVYVNLLANSITGPVIAQTAFVTLSPLSEGSFNFYFQTPAAVTPGTTYYFQPVVADGSADVNVSVFYRYSGGNVYINGAVSPSQQMYFREGILAVPEPSTWALLLLGGGALFFLRRRKAA